MEKNSKWTKNDGKPGENEQKNKKTRAQLSYRKSRVASVFHLFEYRGVE